MKSHIALFASMAAAACGHDELSPDTSTDVAESIDWSWPTHIKGGLGSKPWDGALEVAGGVLDPATGNLTHPVGDWLVYVSLDAANLREAGFGMRLAVMERLAVNGSTVTWQRPDGEQLYFYGDGAGGFVSPVETHARLMQPTANRYEIRYPGSTRLRFERPNSAGWLMVAVVDRNNNTTSLQYDYADRLVRVVDPVGRATQLGYGGTGLLAQIVQHDGQVWDLLYNGWYELAGMRRAADGATHTLAYDPWYLHLLQDHRSPEGQSIAKLDFYYDRSLKGASDAAGAKIVVGYHTGHVRLADSFQKITTLEYTPNGEMRTLIDPIGVPVVRAVYDGLHRVLSRADSTGYTDSFQYDGNHNVIRHVNGNGEVMTASYVDHNPVAVTSATGKTTFYSYGPHDNVTAIVDPSARRTDLSYDANGNLLSVRGSDGTILARYTWDYVGNMTSRTDENGNLEQFYYDGYRNLVYHVTPTSRLWRFVATPDGRPTSITSPRGDRTSIAYDAVNRTSRVDHPDQVIETYAWDRDDRMLEQRRRFGAGGLRLVGPNESVQTCIYDNRGGTGKGINAVPDQSCTRGAAYPDPAVPPPTSTSTSTASSTTAGDS